MNSTASSLPQLLLCLSGGLSLKGLALKHFLAVLISTIQYSLLKDSAGLQ